MDGSLEIPTLQEIIDLVKTLQLSQGRRIGLYRKPSIRRISSSSAWPWKPLVRILTRNGYVGRHAPVYIQSFGVDNLKTLSRLTQLRLVQLFSSGQPYDQQVRGTKLTYAQMATPPGSRPSPLRRRRRPEKSYIIPRDGNGNLGTPTGFVAAAHAVGLKVHPYTFRAENAFLPANLRSSDKRHERGDSEAEIAPSLMPASMACSSTSRISPCACATPTDDHSGSRTGSPFPHSRGSGYPQGSTRQREAA